MFLRFSACFGCALDWIVLGDQLDNSSSMMCSWKVVRTRFRLEVNLDRIGYLLDFVSAFGRDEFLLLSSSLIKVAKAPGPSHRF